MKPQLIATPLKDLFVVEIDYFQDKRGFFIETWHEKDFAAAGLNFRFVQENHSSSRKGVLRGLHYQDMQAPMAKLVKCTVGSIFDVAVDIRVSSLSLGKWFGIELSAENKKQLFIPKGFAHGFVVTSDYAEVQYKQDAFYAPAAEGAIAWNDPDININWPINNPILSKRDQQGMSLGGYLKNPAFS